jgi:hypothetical protein
MYAERKRGLSTLTIRASSHRLHHRFVLTLYSHSTTPRGFRRTRNDTALAQLSIIIPSVQASREFPQNGG